MSVEPTRAINLVEDFYRGLQEIQEYADGWDTRGGRGRRLVNDLMDFALQIIGTAPRAYPVLLMPQHPEREYRRAVFRKRFILIYRITAVEITFLLVYNTRQRPPALPLMA